MKLHLLAATAAAALLAAPAVFAQAPVAGRWTLSGEFGADFPIDGEVHGGRNVVTPSLNLLNPPLVGGAQLHIQPQDWDGVYGTSWGGGVEAGYGLSDNSEVFGTIRYQQAEGSDRIIGFAFFPTSQTTAPIVASYDDHEVWTGEIGYRHFWGEGKFRPYAAARVGTAYTSGITADFAIPDRGVAVSTDFYDDSWSWTVGADLGVDYALSENMSVQVETGLRYISDLSDGDDGGLAALGLEALNDDSGASLSMPVTIRGRWAF